MIRVGFVGTGNIAGRHFTALSKLRDQAEVVAVCDVIEERVTAAAQPLGATCYSRTSMGKLVQPIWNSDGGRVPAARSVW